MQTEAQIKDQYGNSDNRVLPLVVGGLTITCEDNMELMARYPDKYFDLAIVDPPYGLGNKLAHSGNGKNAQSKFSEDFKNKNWDNKVPEKEYFDELFRVSKNQIIWGGNYFDLPPNRGFIIWDKMVFIPTMSRIEQAYNSIDCLPQLVQINNTDKNRIHLTQKPIALYEWVISKYAKENYKILDTHLGSGSIAIAIDNMNKIEKMNLTLTACELDKDYYNNAIKRINQSTNWQSLF
jgi:site-specific DNA-methyltransferase (adenine-specific)